MTRKEIGYCIVLIGILLLFCIAGERINYIESQQAPSVDLYIADLQEQIDILRKDLSDLKDIQQTTIETAIIEDEPIGTLWNGIVPPVEHDSTTSTAQVMEYVGTFKVSAYCPCRLCTGKTDGITASGVKAQEGITVAADWSVLPVGTVIEIEGIGQRIVQDKGSAIKGNRLDLFMNSHKDALNFGIQYLKIWIIK